MARIARVVVPGLPHHITQRGNRGESTFFDDTDYVAYRDLLAASCRRCGTEIWAYCLMPNHVHLVMVPTTEDGLRCALGETHRRYTRMINARQDWCGHLWQERFHSFVMDEPHLLAASRYVERNPVRAGLCATPEQWPWSSARAHLSGEDDALVRVRPLLDLVGDWAGFLADTDAEEDPEQFHRHSRTGRPLGSNAFVTDVENRLGRVLRPQKPGPKPRSRDAQTDELLAGSSKD
ncbi:transposase [Thiohalocapsa marina]|uniref:Transposase n=1 Tax=Thiohalocapsa marina TaxID=424902 RepID=A0A5M8FP79_9GAMM|nr:transposase [Thiohalocapsa marina]KAA6186723.1 transposase [Thiohalocapsa marina]